MAEKISVKISDDGFQATVGSIGPRTTPDEIVEALKSNGVIHGMQTKFILEAIETAQKSGRALSDVLVAEGTPPKITVPTKIEHRPRGADEALPSLKPIAGLLSLESPKGIEEATEGVVALAVQKGDLLAAQVVGTVEPGKTVKGEPVEQIGDADDRNQHLQPGVHVALSSDGAEYRAMTFGYAGILDGKIAVIPPIWIFFEDMRAGFLNLPLAPGSAQPEPADISGALSAAGVTDGIDSAKVKALSKGLSSQRLTKVLVPLAAGVAPVEPVDAAPEFSFPYESRAGAVRADGSIDLKERQRFPSVAESELLVRCKPPVPGSSGLTVKGEEVAVREPVAGELVAGENVKASADGDVQQLFSEIDGGVSVQVAEIATESGKRISYTVSVRSIAQVSGNVDYETGNIDFKGNVEIKGRVLGGFKVKTTGDIVILEGVEDGAEITCDGDLTVKQGIVGPQTKVVAKGGVNAKFIQDASVQAGGDVVADSYIRSANIQSKHSVIVEGSGAGGGIFGGKTWALKSVAAKNVGSERSTTTVLSLGVLPELFDGFAELRREAEKADDSRQALLEAIGIKELKPEQIKQAILRNPHKKGEILRYVQKANECAKVQSDALEKMKSMSANMKKNAEIAYLDVTDTSHARVKVRIGNLEKVLEKDLKAVRFHLDPDAKTGGVVCTNLAEISKE